MTHAPTRSTSTPAVRDSGSAGSIAELGVDVVLCGSFGGETGRVARNR